MSEDYDSDAEETRAEGEAKARVLEARAKLHPAAQIIYAFWDSVGNLITGAGCLLIIAIVVIALLAPEVFGYIFGK